MSLASSAATHNNSTRYHDLDAFRAWAVLLGVVLHAAWLMLPYRLGNPIVDADHSHAMAWLFAFIHLFRMQAFFLVAGFFGNLVYQRRGLRAFCRHRFVRIAIPLAVGWIVLMPWIYVYYAWGELVFGPDATGESFWQRYQRVFAEAFELRFPMMHLWFLWDLLLFYVATLAVKAGLDHLFDRSRRLRTRLSLAFGNLMRSRISVLWLAIPSAVLLLPMKYWLGIEGYPSWLLPDWYGFLSYWLFFAVGWLLYEQRNLLTTVGSRWRFNLAAGFLLSFPIWGMYEYHARPNLTFAYPAILGSDLLDHDALRGAILSARPAADEAPASGTHDEAASDRSAAAPGDAVASQVRTEIWRRLAPAWRRRISEPAPWNPNELAGLADHMTRQAVLAKPLAPSSVDTDSPMEVAVANRQLLETAFSGALARQFVPSYGWLIFKAVYCALYALAMWMLVFGFLGVFQRFFRNPSPSLRYISDSSYWIYLLHIPVMFWIAMYLAPIRIGTVGKFIVYNVLTTAILLPSYHYLVRSSLIGQILNGRRHPYRPFLESELFQSRDPAMRVNVSGRPAAAEETETIGATNGKTR